MSEVNVPSVYVIILNYNHLSDLKETVASFELQDYPNLHLIVSDNGSTDDSISWLKREKPEIHLIENGENLGWAEGNNVGIRYALNDGAEYVLLANNDLSFNKPTLLSQLINRSIQSGALLLGVKQYYYSEPNVVYNEGREFPFRTKLEILESDFIEIHRLWPVDYVPGSFLLIHKSVFEHVGFIEADFFLYAEDADFGYRSLKAGFVSYIAKDLAIMHKVSITSGVLSRLKLYYQIRNQMLFFRRHNDSFKSPIFSLLVYHKRVVKLIIKLILKGNIPGARGVVRGYVHGVIGVKGKGI